jgi:hypothetical protein
MTRLSVLWLVLWALSGQAALGDNSLVVVPYAAPPNTPRLGDWAKARCGGATFPAAGITNWQWTPALAGPGHDYGDDGTVVSGRAVAPGLSASDNPLVHPFGNDFEWYMAVDPKDNDLVASGNANHMLGIEIDSGLMPPDYRVRQGDRVVIAGRFIVDCAHDDFHTEIHPPLLVGAARQSSAGDSTLMTIASRPWLIGQSYPEGNFVDHLRGELVRLLDIPFTKYCCSSQVEVHAPILPPVAASTAYDYWLAVPSGPEQTAVIRYHFAVRHGASVQLFRPRPGFVGLRIALDAATLISAAPPPRHEVTYTAADLEKLDEDGRVKAGFDEARRRLGVAFWAKHSLDKGIVADRYDPLAAPFPACDPGGVLLALSALPVGRRLAMPAD